MTVWIDDQPFSANGKTVGDFIPGNKAMISSNFSFGAFNKIYLF